MAAAQLEKRVWVCQQGLANEYHYVAYRIKVEGIFVDLQLQSLNKDWFSLITLSLCSCKHYIDVCTWLYSYTSHTCTGINIQFTASGCISAQNTSTGLCFLQTTRLYCRVQTCKHAYDYRGPLEEKPYKSCTWQPACSWVLCMAACKLLRGRQAGIVGFITLQSKVCHPRWHHMTATPCSIGDTSSTWKMYMAACELFTAVHGSLRALESCTWQPVSSSEL